MADREDIYRWLQGASWRHTTLDQRKLIEGLISEGRAEWVNRWNRARAIPNPLPKAKRDHKTEAAKLRRFVESIRDNWDCDTGANGTHPDYCRVCTARTLLSNNKGESE